MGFEYFLRHSDQSARVQPHSPLDPCPMFWISLEGEQGMGTGCVKGNKQNDGDSVILLIHPHGAQSHIRGSSATSSQAQESLASLKISVPHAPGLTVQFSFFIFKNCYMASEGLVDVPMWSHQTQPLGTTHREPGTQDTAGACCPGACGGTRSPAQAPSLGTGPYISTVPEPVIKRSPSLCVSPGEGSILPFRQDPRSSAFFCIPTSPAFLRLVHSLASSHPNP